MNPCNPARKKFTVSSRQRLLLHRLLHRELRGCTASALNSAQRCGWVFGAAGDYQLTEAGRRLAELSELTPPDRELQLDVERPATF